MARRRRRRRNPLPLALANPINSGDWTPILVGAVGGGLAMWLYLKSVTTTAPTQTVSLTTPTLPTVQQQPTS